MNNIDKKLLKELIEKWDTASAVKLVKEIVHDNRFLGNDNKVKEPFRTFLQLKLLGFRPVRLLILLDHIQKRDKTTRPDLAGSLGAKFDNGTPRQEIASLLDCLEKLDILQGEEAAPKGSKTRAYSIRKLELHLSQKNLEEILSGKEFAWSNFNLIDFIDKEYASRYKLKDFDGTDISFRPFSIFEDIIRCGVTSSIAWTIISILLNEIAEGRLRDKQTVNKVVAQELHKINPNAAEKFLSINPIGLKLKGGKYDGKFLTYNIVEEILQQYLQKNGITCLPAKPYREIILVTLNQCMKDIRTRHEIEESEIPGILQFAIYRVYGKSLDEILSDFQTHLKKSNWQLEEAIDKVEANEVTQTRKCLLGALSSCLTYFCLGIGLLPGKDDVAIVSLVEDLLTSKQTEHLVEPQAKEKKIKKKLVDALQRKNIDVDKLLKCLDLLLSIEREEISGVTFRDPSALCNSLKNICDFMKNLLQAFEQN